MLFFDPRVSGSHLISSNTCHNLSMGGDDNLETSIGHGWAKGPRNAPTVLNAVFNKDSIQAPVAERPIALPPVAGRGAQWPRRTASAIRIACAPIREI